MRQVPFRSIPVWWRQANFQDFREKYAAQCADRKSSSLLLFIGSGLSIHAGVGLKSWKGLLCDLAARDGNGHPEPPEAAAARAERVLKILETRTDEHRYLDAGTLLKAEYGEIEWRAKLDKLLNGPRVREARPKVHRALAHVPWRRIITTNYDCLIENVYRAEPHGEDGAQADIRVVHPQHGDVHVVENGTDRAIYKIHGDIADPDSALVLAREDYDRLYANEGESARFSLSLATIVRTSHPILFLGYGHTDPYLSKLWRFVRQGVEVRNDVFALMPIEDTLPAFERSAQRFEAEDHIKVIGYSTDDDYAELPEFVEYLSRFDDLDPEYAQASTQERPTVVMVYCGGTIGAKQPPDPHAPLQVNRQMTRFGPDLEEYKRKLLNWYHDFYHAGSDLPELDVVWEILPPGYQMFSENATPEYWSVLTDVVERVINKYIRLPREVGTLQEGLIPQSLMAEFDEDRRQYQAAHGGGSAQPMAGGLSEKRFLNSISNRYVLGIVLLGGTDTLAYSAAALSVGMQHLPCPVVLTGSSQPPYSTQLPPNQRGRFFTTSDAWRNLMTTLYFLQSFGHTLTEVFVCFADTVHNGVNLRKVATGGIPYARDPAGRRGGEHFTFRNLSYRCQYMFRMIDGLFCNNFYPRDGITFAALVGQDKDEFGDLRHVRHYSDDRGRKFETYGFSTRVWHLKATPCAPEIDVESLKRADRLPWVVMLEGYTSGTYPTSERSNLFTLLEALDAEGIPFVITAPFGLRPAGLAYETSKSRITGKTIPPLSLYGVTEEFALPLLCRLVNDIRSDPVKHRAWTRAKRSRASRVRIQLLCEEIDSFFSQRPNLITEELVGLRERDKNMARRDRLAAEMRSSDRTGHGWDPRFGIFEALKRRVHNTAPGAEGDQADIGVQGYPKKGVILSREGFAAMVDEIVRPFQRVGAAPDGFAVLSNIGFEMGLNIVGTIGDWSRAQYPLKRFRDQPAAQKADGISVATRVLEEVMKICREAGLAEVGIHSQICTGPDLAAWKDGVPAEWLRFGVRLERQDPVDWMHEKYAVVTFSDDDREFFRILMEGTRPKTPAKYAAGEREMAYTDLLLNRWQHNLSSGDWFMMGLWKGVACGIARGLRFDSLAVEGRYMQPGHLRALRQAVRCEILFGNPHAFGLEFSYYAVGEQPSPRATADALQPAGLLTDGPGPERPHLAAVVSEGSGDRDPPG